MVGRLGPLFRTAGHRVRTQHGVSTSAENRQKRGDVEILNYLQDAAGSRNLVFDLAVTHDRYGSSAHSFFIGPTVINIHICPSPRSTEVPKKNK